MRIEIDQETREWLLAKGGKVTLIPPRPQVG